MVMRFEAMGEDGGNAEGRAGRWNGARLLLRAMAFGTLVAAASVQAQGHGPHGMGGMGGHHDGGMRMFGGSPERASRAIERMLDGLNATDAQRMQIKQIAAAAAADLQAQRQTGRAFKEQALAVFTAPTVDARAAETLRAQMSALGDQTSKRMLQAMLEVAGALTPEQRAKLGERMRERQSMMRERMQRMQERGPGAPSPTPR